MKKFLLLFLFCYFLYSCNKKSFHPEPGQVTGFLHFSGPAADGIGLYFLTDADRNLHQEYIFLL
jgi:hypothetical protein